MNFNKVSKNIYRLPFDENLNLKPEPAPSHIGPMINAIDFSMREGVEIYAAADGIVVEIKENFKIGRNDKSLRYKANLVRIKHDNDEYTDYGHLKFKGVKVKLKQKVKAGDLIGYSGFTGFTSYPHLHFSVYEYISAKEYWRTLIPKFIKDGKIITLESPDKNNDN